MEGRTTSSNGVMTLATAGAGIATLIVVVATTGVAAPYVVLTWLLLAGGVVLAIVPGRARPAAPGLVLAALALPLAALAWLWLALTGAVLFG